MTTGRPDLDAYNEAIAMGMSTAELVIALTSLLGAMLSDCVIASGDDDEDPAIPPCRLDRS